MNLSASAYLPATAELFLEAKSRMQYPFLMSPWIPGPYFPINTLITLFCNDLVIFLTPIIYTFNEQDICLIQIHTNTHTHTHTYTCHMPQSRAYYRPSMNRFHRKMKILSAFSKLQTKLSLNLSISIALCLKLSNIAKIRGFVFTLRISLFQKLIFILQQQSPKMLNTNLKLR